MKRVAGLTIALLVVIVAVAAAQGASASKKMINVRGVVKSVSASSLVITVGNKDMTFDVDSSTRIIGRGVGTKSDAAKSARKPLVITDVVQVKNNVQVGYHDMGGGKLHAATVRVR